jgi:copper homeostasis protein
MNNQKYIQVPILEVCAGDIDSVKAAIEGGAQRVELCSALDEGGVTPSYGFIEKALSLGDIEVNVLIRPRSGDFLYSSEEVDIMCQDIRQCVNMGVNGIVVGALRHDGYIDFDICRRFVDLAEDVSLTFHRAFDMCCKPMIALEEVIRLGFDRILTSGLASSAWEGRELISRLHQQADGRVKIMAGGGINPDNAAKIIRATGVSEIHASARRNVCSKMLFQPKNVNMGRSDINEFNRKTTSAEIVKNIVTSISQI